MYPVGVSRVAPATLLALLLAPNAALAGAWTQPRGNSYLKIYSKVLVGKSAFISGRTTEALPSLYQDYQLSLYGEYGVTEDVTAVLEATPFGVAHYDGNTDPYVGGGIASLRDWLMSGPLAVAAQVHLGGRPSLGAPTGTATIDGHTYRITPVVGTLRGGGSVHVGRAFGRTWLTGHAGARFFSAEALKPALFAFLQGGWHIYDALTAEFHVTFWHSLGDLEPIEVLGTGQTRYLGYGLGVSWWLTPHVGLNAGIDGAVYAAANAATPAFLLGVELR